MISLKKHTQVALAYFLTAALLGVFLRFFFVTFIPADFRYVVHAHSHIALLGWVYLAISTLIYKMYFSGAGLDKLYKRIFWFTQITILGMLFTFPFTGYAALSITFSTAFLFASYLWTWFVIKKIPQDYRNTASFKCIRAALWYLIFSSIGPWALGGIMATLGKASIWYKMAIYFYLHFQYNGWFILALVGILLFLFEKRSLQPERKQFSRFFYLLNAGILLSFFLSVLWADPHWVYYVLATLGAIVQVMAFMEFFEMVLPLWKRSAFSPQVKTLVKIGAFLLIVKIILQLFSAHPFFAALAFQYTDFVIGYLHWTFLGLVSISLFAFLLNSGLLQIPKAAIWLYLTAFVLSEGLIFYKGMSLAFGLSFIPDYHTVLFSISSLFPVSIGMILFKSLLRKNQKLS